MYLTMKKIFLTILGIGLLTACQDELYRNDLEENIVGQGVYLEGGKSVQLYVQAGKEYSVDNLTAKLVKPQTSNVAIGITSGSQSQLDAYNQANGTSYELLPREMYQIGTSVNVATSSIEAAIPLKIKNVVFKDGVTYALPIKVLGGISGQSESMVILEEEIVSKVLRMQARTGSGGASTGHIFPDNHTVPEWTLEITINRPAYSANNQALCGTNDKDHPRSEIYPRFGDVTIKPSQLQIKTGGAQIDVPESAFTAKTNEWYPIAFTYDGKITRVYVNGNEVASAEIREGAYSVTGFWIGGVRGLVREVRFWKKAIPAATIKQNMWKTINPKSADLLFYYPLNGKKYDQATGVITEDESKIWDWSVTGAHLPVPSHARFDDNNGDNHIFPPKK